MDLMEVRRQMMGVIAHMSKGAEIIKGSFTTNNNATYTINIGKALDKYLFIIEMTDESKSDLLSTGQTSAKMYACAGMYQTPEINKIRPEDCILSYRVVPTTGVTSYSGSTINGINDSSMTFTNNTPQNGANVLYRGYTYNYMILPID